MNIRHVAHSALAAAVAAVISTSTVASEAVDKGLTLTAGGAYTDFDSERSLDNALSPEIGVGYRYNSQLSVELLYSEFKTDQRGNSNNARLKNYRLDGFYDFAPLGNGLTPYIVAGIGEFQENLEHAKDRDDTRMNVGAGLRTYLTPNLSLRSDLRAVRSLDYNQTEGMMNVALTWTFGSVSKPVVEAPIEPAQIAEPAKPVLQDRDRDGVVDASDLCPNSAAGAVVNASGCVEQEAIDLLVEFDFDSDNVRSAALDRVEKMGKYMQRNSDIKIVVEGHTDNKGAAAYNKRLSQKRADAVRTILIEQYNIEANRVEAVGYGEEKPAASNATDEGRQQNRRVLAVIR
ncbi:OmpA family protein [Parendozoicomonas sp. Alg238-R29]|uniref:OmpA family protein n=1 Tax=Parendozoicomonas sp. Alg238-R29 TaxID=2993446 RepID=UPI00248E59C2|nr:OmpA family protein [Parendozoicomonas sp. Alg238-R29]